MHYYLAIDIGASSGRHILGWVDNGRLYTEEIYRFANGAEAVYEHGEKHLKWQHDRLFTEILNGLKKAKEIGKIPCSVSIDTWGVDYLLLDEQDQPIGEAYCYRDARTEKTVPLVHQKVPFETLYQRTGIQFAAFNTIYQLYDDLQTGRMAKAESLLMTPDYFHFLLTGVKKQEYTIATTTGLVNAATHIWDWDLIRALGYKKELFLEPGQPTEEVGVFTEEIAKAVGYSATVVLPAAHDTASAVLAAPLEGETPYISSGTWSLLGVEQKTAHTHTAACRSGFSNEGGLHHTFRFQKNIMGLWMVQQVRKEQGEDYDFATLAEMARKNPIEDEIDVNDPRFLAPENMSEEIQKAVGQRLKLGELAYVIYNNLARDYARSIETLESITENRYSTLHIIGGGSKNQLLNQLTKEKTGKRILIGPTEGTALGNLMAQMLRTKEFNTIEEGRAMLRRSCNIQEV